MATDLRPFTSAACSGCTGRITVREKRGAETVELTHDFRATSKLAESMLVMGIEKGMGIYLEGWLKRDEWRARDTGERKHHEYLVVTHWDFTDDRDRDVAMSRCPIVPTAEKID